MELQSSLHSPVLSKLKSRCLFSHYHQSELRAELSPARVHCIWVPAYFHPKDPGLWTSAHLFSTVQYNLFHLHLRSHGRPTTPWAPKAIWLLHLHSPLAGMISRVLVGDSGVTAYGSQESLQVGIHQKDTAPNPSPLSQTPALHHFPWFLEHICDTVSTTSIHHL